MSFAGPDAVRDGIEPSKVISKEDDHNVRDGIWDCGADYQPKDGFPQVIVGNKHTGCRAEYFPRLGQKPMNFIFHHGIMEFATTCGCLIKSKARAVTYDVPQELAEHGMRLVEHELETKYAAVVVMKLFLGLSVPESVRGQFPEGKHPNDRAKRDGKSHSTLSYLSAIEEEK